MRSLLASESKRGDAAELALQDAQTKLERQDHELGENREKMNAAAVQMAALEVALQEKMDQVIRHVEQSTESPGIWGVGF